MNTETHDQVGSTEPIETVRDEAIPDGWARHHGRLIPMSKAQREIEKARRRRARTAGPGPDPSELSAEDTTAPARRPPAARRKLRRSKAARKAATKSRKRNR